MRPTDLGLPSKFRDYRKGQYDAVIAAACSDKRFTLMSIPTGGGKSAMYMSVAAMLQARALVLTGTKGLQQQLTYDFGAMGLRDVRGQSNYRCIALDANAEYEGYGTPGSGCDHGPCHVGLLCGLRKGGCLYYDAVRAASRAQFVVTNYAYWMTANRYADPESLGKFDLLILDEAHDAPDQLADFCTIHLDRGEVKSLLEMRLPPLDEGTEVWIDWANQALARCREVYQETKAEMTTIGGDRRAAARKLRRVVDLGRKLKELAAAHAWKRGEPGVPDVWMPGAATDWVAETTPSGAVFSPIWAHAYAEQYLFKSIPRIMLVSATLQPVVARYLGIDPVNMEWREFTSTFHPDRRPLIFCPTTEVDRHWTEGQIRIWVNKIDSIIDKRLDRKGIIHARSYERAALIMARSRHAKGGAGGGILLSHGRRDVREVVEQFRKRSAPCVLVSPSVETGYDFPYDACYYQIIVKVPFPDGRSAVIRERARTDKAYLNYLTARALIQQTGRGMRAEDDMCETIVIDNHMDWFWPAAKRQKLIPEWFRRAYRVEMGVPNPPPVPRRMGE